MTLEALERPRRQHRKGPAAMTDISETERLALITHTQGDLFSKEVEISEQMPSELRKRRALRGDVLIIDWATGQAAVYSDNVIPFHQMKFGKR